MSMTMCAMREAGLAHRGSLQKHMRARKRHDTGVIVALPLTARRRDSVAFSAALMCASLDVP